MSDTCKSNICYCGPEDKCTDKADKCTGGKCKCGENDACSTTEICSFGKCIRKYFHFSEKAISFRTTNNIYI